ncbi:MAG: type II toxin-antitoxin system VapC family toxin [Candidatus Omnitrophica bacterium]|nr:type II toxin-antitoxin system VapC family toxin [Candidatus Omnitrophota bacterium]
MVLVDTSVWVDHLKRTSAKLGELLEQGEVVIHPFVVGELACGNLRNRHEILSLLHSLPDVPRAEDDEILFFIERHFLAGKGLGLIDAHLLASGQMGDHLLWTRDKHLKAVAEALGMDFGQQSAADDT